MRRVLAALTVCLLLVGPLSLSGTSQEDVSRKLKEVQELLRKLREADEEAAGLEDFLARDEGRVVRVYNVANLTVRLIDFVKPYMRLRPSGSELDEDQPMFGKARDGEILFADSDALAELIQSNVRPELFETGRAYLSASWPHAIVVAAEPEVQEEVAEYLTDLGRAVGRIVTTELRLVELEDSSRLDRRSAVLEPAEGRALLEAAEAGEGARLLASGRVTGFNGERVVLYAASQLSFVQDYDVEVAQEAGIADPIVQILQRGLSLEVRGTARGEGLVVLDVAADVSSEGGERRESETSGGPVSAPAQRLMEVSTTVTMPNGGYALIGAGGAPNGRSWALLVSATVERVASSGGAK